MTIKIVFPSILAICLLAGCQYNRLDEPVDCSQSDIYFSTTIGSPDCGLNNGSIEVLAVGGEAPFSYSINNGPVQSSSVFNNLGAGEYDLVVIDNQGCSIENKVLIANKNGLSVSVVTTVADCNTVNGSILVTASEGLAPYQYQLDGGSPQDSSKFIVAPGIYNITVSDTNGCQFTLSQQVNSTTSYLNDIQPIIAMSCAIFGCHDGSNTSLPNYNILSELQAKAEEVKSRTQSRNMPRTGSLTQAEIDLIACWVDDGAMDN
jgi:SprB repeat